MAHDVDRHDTASSNENAKLHANMKDVKLERNEPSDNEYGRVLSLCNDYLNSGKETILHETLALVQYDDFSLEVAQELLDALLGSNDESRSRDAIVAAILSRPIGRSALARRLATNPTTNFHAIWLIGEKSMDGMTRTCLTMESWASVEGRETAIKGIFLLLLSVLLEPEDDRAEIAMKAIAKLMVADAATLESSIGPQNLAIILSFLDIQQSIGLRSQATLITAKFLEVSQARGKGLVKDYVIPRIGKHIIDDVVAGFSVAGALFPIVPDTASSLFLTPGFLEDVVTPVKKSKSNRLRLAALELLSAACIDKDCRAAIKAKCTEWLRTVMREQKSDKDIVMAALILSKTGQEADELRTGKIQDVSEDLTTTFTRLLLGPEDFQTQTAIEGLAYRSIVPETKEEIANDPTLLKRITTAMLHPENKGPLVFGGLTIFSNLTKYPVEMSAEQKKMAQLKAYANQSKLAESSPFENTPHVNSRCHKVLDAGIVPVLVKIVKHASPVLLGLVATIAVNLSKERKHCGRMIQQGIMDIIIPLSSYQGTDAALTVAQRASAQALARLIIPINPSLIFSNQQNTPNARSITNAVRVLKILLDDTDSEDPRPAFEALQALTNLASMGEEICEFITSQSFASIEPYLVSTRTALQQAAAECISNLSACNPCISMFVVEPGSQPDFPTTTGGEEDAQHLYESRFLRLRNMCEDDVRGTRLAAMATLFNVTQVEPGVRMLMLAPNGLQRLVKQMETTETMKKSQSKSIMDVDMLSRTLGVVCNVLQYGGNEARDCLRELGLKKILDKIETPNSEDQLCHFKNEALRLLEA